MGIDWEEMLGVEGDEMWQAYEGLVCDAAALETRDSYYDSCDHGTGRSAIADGKDTSGGAGFLCKVAGVTFDNPDGENRQDVIREIIDRKGDGRIWAGPGKLKKVKGESIDPSWEGRVTEVIVDGKSIGLVPREGKAAVVAYRRAHNCSVVVRLEYYPEHDICTAKLFKPNTGKPTPKMEYAVRKVLEKHPHLDPPEKTFDAYHEFLNDHYSDAADPVKFNKWTL